MMTEVSRGITRDDILAGIVLEFMESKEIKKETYLKKVFKICWQHNRSMADKTYTLNEYLMGRIFNIRNILGGRYLNKLIIDLVEDKGIYKIDEEHSFKKYVPMEVYEEVYEYINTIMLEYESDKHKLKEEAYFYSVLTNIMTLTEEGRKGKRNKVSLGNKDVDLMFRDRETNVLHICEIKMRNNHSTDTKRDMVRSFYEKFAYAVAKFNIKDLKDIRPMLLFFEEDKAYDFRGIANCEHGVITGRMFLETYTNYTAKEVEEKIIDIRDKKIFSLGIKTHKESLLTFVHKINDLADCFLEEITEDFEVFQRNVKEKGCF